jgi:hypothetical protein
MFFLVYPREIYETTLKYPKKSNPSTFFLTYYSQIVLHFDAKQFIYISNCVLKAHTFEYKGSMTVVTTPDRSELYICKYE